MSPPDVRIILSGSAYDNATENHQALANFAYFCIEAGQFDVARENLNRLLESKQIQENPLIVETYMMLGVIALQRQEHAEACAWFRLSRKPNYEAPGARRGTREENEPVYHANDAMYRYLRSLIRQPRTIGVPPASFEKEFNPATCTEKSLRVWAFGKFVAMSTLMVAAVKESLRGAQETDFSAPPGQYLFLPPSEQGEPRVVLPSEIPAILYGWRGQSLCDPVTRCIFNDHVLERAKGNPNGWPEGYFFCIGEMVTYMQSDTAIRSLGLYPNLRAEALLHLEEGVWGPVLLQVCYLLKHPKTAHSPVAIRMAPELPFLASDEWRQMRMEYRALGPGPMSREVQCGEITSFEALTLADPERARFHVHAK